MSDADPHANPNLAHHFHDMAQQTSSAKVGMWVFLATEVLMFGGLFCAYAIYRGTHPEVFLFAHLYLDTFWGAFNTVVLLVSSFTMAWAVRASQLGQNSLMSVLLVLTFFGGVGFMCVKYVEYKSKFEHGLPPGFFNAFYNSDGQFSDSPEHEHRLAEALYYHEKKVHEREHDVAAVDKALGLHGTEAEAVADADHGESHEQQAEADEAAHDDQLEAIFARSNLPSDHTNMTLASNGNMGVSALFMADGAAGEPNTAAQAAHTGHTLVTWQDMDSRQRNLVYQFFQIYYAMTGLHGLHVLIGMGLIAWVFFRGLAGDFTPAFNTPVDLVGLYWHLVDLIWIFLFPLLYLIH